MQKIKKAITYIRSYYYKRRAKGKMLRSFYLRLEENKIIQPYIKQRILEGQAFRRRELTEKQGEKEELEKLIYFLKKNI